MSVRSASIRHRGVAASAACLLGLSAGTTSAVGVDVDRPIVRHSPSVVTTTTVTDPDDVDGRFDIASVSHMVSETDRRHVGIVYSVRTYPAWADPRLDRRFRTFVLELNRDRDRGSEFNLRVSKRDGHLVAELISNATRVVIRRVRVTRLDSRSFTISGPRRVIGARSYFWTSNFHSDAPRTPCGNSGGYPVTCQDSVPNRGWIRMNSSAWPWTSD